MRCLRRALEGLRCFVGGLRCWRAGRSGWSPIATEVDNDVPELRGIPFTGSACLRHPLCSTRRPISGLEIAHRMLSFATPGSHSPTRTAPSIGPHTCLSTSTPAINSLPDRPCKRNGPFVPAYAGGNA